MECKGAMAEKADEVFQVEVLTCRVIKSDVFINTIQVLKVRSSSLWRADVEEHVSVYVLLKLYADLKYFMQSEVVLCHRFSRSYIYPDACVCLYSLLLWSAV